MTPTKINIKRSLLALWLALSLLLSSCSLFDNGGGDEPPISLDDIPAYSGAAYVDINGGIPFFTEDELTSVAFESYAELDALGRCGVAFACIGPELMPPADEERESISSVTPSGWKYNGVSNNNVYSFVENNYIYNRCHLIGFQLTGENANRSNLITGTRYLNIEGMLPFENMVADYIKLTGNHVMYRVTPIFEEYNLVASGVLIEALSVEDSGEEISFCVYSYNVQPGVEINYFTGTNRQAGDSGTDLGPTEGTEPEAPENGSADDEATVTYILNTNTKKIHETTCTHAPNGANREETTKDMTTLLGEGYTACGICKPE